MALSVVGPRALAGWLLHVRAVVVLRTMVGSLLFPVWSLRLRVLSVVSYLGMSRSPLLPMLGGVGPRAVAGWLLLVAPAVVGVWSPRLSVPSVVSSLSMARSRRLPVRNVVVPFVVAGWLLLVRLGVAAPRLTQRPQIPVLGVVDQLGTTWSPLLLVPNVVPRMTAGSLALPLRRVTGPRFRAQRPLSLVLDVLGFHMPVGSLRLLSPSGADLLDRAPRFLSRVAPGVVCPPTERRFRYRVLGVADPFPLASSPPLTSIDGTPLTTARRSVAGRGALPVQGRRLPPPGPS
jgi:hypothetical protein